MECQLLIRNGTIVDGSGQHEPYVADLAVNNDKIAAIGHLAYIAAERTIDASGKMVAPGFIDVHVHSEVALLTGDSCYGDLCQGVTTQFLAADGFGWAPLDSELGQAMQEYTLFAYGHPEYPLPRPTPQAYLDMFAGHTPANVVAQVPHNTVRYAVMGWAPQPAASDELAAMSNVVRDWMDAGAVSLCVGLDYQPSAYADTRELVALSKLVAQYGGCLAAHVRYTDLGKPGAWREVMEVGQQASIPVHISHEFVADETAPLLDEASQYCDLTFDSYLYPAGCSHLAQLLPTWAQAGGAAGLRPRLRNAATRQRIIEHLQHVLEARINAGGDVVFAANQTGRYIGKGIAVAAAEEGKTLGEFTTDVLTEEDPYALVVLHHPGNPSDLALMVQRTAAHPRLLVASDGIYHGQHGHPRAYGCFARVLRLFVRELGVLSITEAVYKMSGFPAQRFGLADRGVLQPGYAADIVIFDPATVGDRATWQQPRLKPVGIEWVLVNGQVVVQQGQPTGALPGRVLRPLRH